MQEKPIRNEEIVKDKINEKNKEDINTSKKLKVESKQEVILLRNEQAIIFCFENTEGTLQINTPHLVDFVDVMNVLARCEKVSNMLGIESEKNKEESKNVT